MDYILAIGYVETVMLEVKQKEEKEKLTMENIESRLSTLLDKKKEIIIAYVKIAYNNIKNSKKQVAIREMEAQIQNIKDLYTLEELIEKAKKL